MSSSRQPGLDGANDGKIPDEAKIRQHISISRRLLDARHLDLVSMFHGAGVYPVPRFRAATSYFTMFGFSLPVSNFVSKANGLLPTIDVRRIRQPILC